MSQLNQLVILKKLSTSNENKETSTFKITPGAVGPSLVWDMVVALKVTGACHLRPVSKQPELSDGHRHKFSLTMLNPMWTGENKATNRKEFS